MEFKRRFLWSSIAVLAIALPSYEQGPLLAQSQSTKQASRNPVAPPSLPDPAKTDEGLRAKVQVELAKAAEAGKAKDFALAISYCQKALELSEGLSHWPRGDVQMLALKYLARFEQNLEKPDYGEATFLRRHQMIVDWAGGRSSALAGSYIDLASLRLDRENYRQAEDDARRGAAMYDQVALVFRNKPEFAKQVDGALREKVNALSVLGFALTFQRKTDEGLKVWDDAYTLGERVRAQPSTLYGIAQSASEVLLRINRSEGSRAWKERARKYQALAAEPERPLEPEEGGTLYSGPEYTSPDGKPYFEQEDRDGTVWRAFQNLDADRRNVELALALGRAQGGAWRFDDAIQAFTYGLELAPNDARFLVARGHRYISTRQFAKARADLERAAALDPKAEGLWYHLGLVHYVAGEFEKAAAAFEKSRDTAADAAARVGPSDWLYMSLRRAGKAAEAAKLLESVSAEMKITGNENLYYSRLLLYKGLKTEAELEIPAPSAEMAAELRAATLAYGLGNWHLYNGNQAKARELFQRATATRAWPAFGFICAEADLARMK